MKRLFSVVMVLVATGCGSTGTDSSGTGDDDDDGSSGAFTCSSFTAGAGVVCDSSTTPPTIRVDFGTGANQAVPGDDPRLAAIDPNKGKYISSFTPTVGTEAIGGMLIKNAATGRIGIRAADELCKAKNTSFPNAHMCTMDEVFWNVRNGFIAAGAQGIAFAHGREAGLGGAANSFKANCGNLTYNSADLQYTGSRWSVAASDPKAQADGDAGNDNLAAVAMNVEGGLACNSTAIPIACCQ